MPLNHSWKGRIKFRHSLFIMMLILMTEVCSQAQEVTQAPEGQSASSSVKADPELERQKLQVEIWKAGLYAGAIILPLIGGFLTLGYRARTAFELKAAEIVLSSRSPAAARGRAEVLKQLFPKRLPENFASSFDAMKLPGTRSEDKLKLLRMIMEHPERKGEIIEMWSKLFPWDKEWLPEAKSDEANHA